MARWLHEAVDTDRDAIAMQATLGASALAQQALTEKVARNDLSPDALERIAAQESHPPLVVALVVDNQGRPLSGRASQQALDAEPTLAAWLAASVAGVRRTR